MRVRRLRLPVRGTREQSNQRSLIHGSYAFRKGLIMRTLEPSNTRPSAILMVLLLMGAFHPFVLY